MDVLIPMFKLSEDFVCRSRGNSDGAFASFVYHLWSNLVRTQLTVVFVSSALLWSINDIKHRHFERR